MKKFITLVILFFITIISGIAQEFQVYPMQLVSTFKVGKNTGQIKTDMNVPSENGPKAFVFDKEESLYISDILNRKLVKYDKNFLFIKEYFDCSSWGARQLFINNNGEFISYGNIGITVDTPDLKKKVVINLWDSKYQKEFVKNSFIYHNNIVYFYLKNKELMYLDNPRIDNRANTQIIHNINDLQKTNRALNLKVDEKNRLFFDNELLNTDYKSFITYHSEKRQTNESNSKIKLSFDITKLKSTKFLGKDTDKNYYFSVGFKWIYVFNNDGILLDVFEFEKDKAQILPTIHPSGDIYFLDYDAKQVYLYKIPRQW